MIKNKTVKKLLSTMLCAIIVAAYFVPLNAFATGKIGITGKCMWQLDGTVLTISSSINGGGKMDDYTPYSAPRGTDITDVIITNVQKINMFFMLAQDLKT